MSQNRCSSPKIKQEEEEIGLGPEEAYESILIPQARKRARRDWSDETNRVLIDCMIKLDFHTQHISRNRNVTFAGLHKDFISNLKITESAKNQSTSEFIRDMTVHDVSKKYYTLRKLFTDIKKRIINERISPPHSHLHRHFDDLNKVFGFDATLLYPRNRMVKKRTTSLLTIKSPPLSPILTATPITTPPPPPPPPPPPEEEPVPNVLNSILTELQLFNTNFLRSVATTNKLRERIAKRDRKSREKIAAKDRKSREKIAALDREARSK